MLCCSVGLIIFNVHFIMSVQLYYRHYSGGRGLHVGQPAHGALRDAAHRHYEGVFYSQHIARFHGTRVDVI